MYRNIKFHIKLQTIVYQKGGHEGDHLRFEFPRSRAWDKNSCDSDLVETASSKNHQGNGTRKRRSGNFMVSMYHRESSGNNTQVTLKYFRVTQLSSSPMGLGYWSSPPIRHRLGAMNRSHKTLGTSSSPCTQAKQVMTAGGQLANKDTQVLAVGRKSTPTKSRRA